MNAKHLLIAHGEKLIVLAVAAGCGIVLWNAIDDPSIRPKDSLQAIEVINQKIDRVFKTQKPPLLQEPSPYLDKLLARVAEPIPATPIMAWLTNPPDKGRSGGDPGTYLYIYEIATPTVTISDAIGSLNIAIRMPDANEAGKDRRVSAGALVEWPRNERGTVINRGRHLGLRLEIKVGDGAWGPLRLPGATPEGILPLAAIPSGDITIPTPEPWQRHRIRARIVAAATALNIDGAWIDRPRDSVLVIDRLLNIGPAEERKFIDRTRDQVKAKQGELFNAFLRPSDIQLPSAISIDTQHEKVFEGQWSPVAMVDATDSVRFALIGRSSMPVGNDFAQVRDVGRFQLLRLFEQNGQHKWMEKPIDLKMGVGDKLAATQVKLPNPFNPTQTIEVNLETPFVIEKLDKQPRILYWTIKAKARQNGGKDRDLDLDKKQIDTDVAVLRNSVTGTTLTLTKLSTISPPSNPNILLYPHRSAAYAEGDEFTKAPSEFRQWGLTPEQPTQYAPDTGPLVDLYKAKVEAGALDKNSYRTDAPYYVIPDGRVVWWDTVEHVVKVHDPEGVMKSATTIPDQVPQTNPSEAPGEPAPTGTANPARTTP